MNNEIQQELTVKEKYENCKGFECPRFLGITREHEDGTRYFAEGDLAYTAMVLCNNWGIGLSDGNCPIKPVDVVEEEI